MTSLSAAPFCACIPGSRCEAHRRQHERQHVAQPVCENVWSKNGRTHRCTNPADAGRYHRPDVLGGPVNACRKCIPVMLDRNLVTWRIGEAV